MYVRVWAGGSMYVRVYMQTCHVDVCRCKYDVQRKGKGRQSENLIQHTQKKKNILV